MRIRFTAPVSFVPAFLAGFVLLLTLPGHAAAAKPCWERVIDDWLASPNATITGTYKPSCLLRALKYAEGREDLRDYSNITEAISAALQAALRDVPRTHSGTPAAIGPARGHTSTNSNKEGGTVQGVPPSPYAQAIRKLGRTSADSVPIPLLVLAGLGCFLLVTAGGLAATKWIRTTREGRGMPPPAKP